MKIENQQKIRKLKKEIAGYFFYSTILTLFIVSNYFGKKYQMMVTADQIKFWIFRFILIFIAFGVFVPSIITKVRHINLLKNETIDV
jgi:pilus assembly protein TadC